MIPPFSAWDPAVKAFFAMSLVLAIAAVAIPVAFILAVWA